jgi:hypothetical protein
MINFIRDGQLWINVTAEHAEHGGMDPTEFYWISGLPKKHFKLSADELCWHFSPVAYKKWQETNKVSKRSMDRIFADLFLG